MKSQKLIGACLLCGFLLGLIWILCADCRAAEPVNDWAAEMVAACVAGDTERGLNAQEQRNAKIVRLDLDYVPVFYEELVLLSKIVYAEAGSYWLPEYWKMCVGEVVLNRIDSPEFPDTLIEVLEQPGQYYGKNSSYFNALRPNEASVLAALKLLSGERVLNDPRVVFQANFPQGSGCAVILHDRYLGSSYFCYSAHPELYGG